MLPDDIFSNPFPEFNFTEEEPAAETLNPGITDPGAFPAETPIAMAYVPVQRFVRLFTPEKGFEVGTLYEELYKPWLPGRSRADE